MLSPHLFWTSGLWTYQSGSHRQEECHTGFLHLPSAVLALIFIARRVQRKDEVKARVVIAMREIYK